MFLPISHQAYLYCSLYQCCCVEDDHISPSGVLTKILPEISSTPGLSVSIHPPRHPQKSQCQSGLPLSQPPPRWREASGSLPHALNANIYFSFFHMVLIIFVCGFVYITLTSKCQFGRVFAILNFNGIV